MTTTYVSRIKQIQATFKKRLIAVDTPESEFPELLVTIPDNWPYVDLAPLYDVHIGHKLHAGSLFDRHLDWLAKEKYVLSWNGGDMFENVIDGSPGMFSQRIHPGEQFDAAVEKIAPIQHKMMFAIPGNHEARTFNKCGFDIAKHLADDADLPYFSDYCLCTLKWRGMNFRLVAHHGSGAAATPGGQRNAARKDMPWIGADMYWTGHLHQPIADVVYRADYNQRTNRLTSRNSVVIISPSYLRYFGGWAASRRMGPGALGLTVARLQPNGNIETTLHAKGARL